MSEFTDGHEKYVADNGLEVQETVDPHQPYGSEYIAKMREAWSDRVKTVATYDEHGKPIDGNDGVITIDSMSEYKPPTGIGHIMLMDEEGNPIPNPYLATFKQPSFYPQALTWKELRAKKAAKKKALKMKRAMWREDARRP